MSRTQGQLHNFPVYRASENSTGGGKNRVLGPNICILASSVYFITVFSDIVTNFGGFFLPEFFILLPNEIIHVSSFYKL